LPIAVIKLSALLARQIKGRQGDGSPDRFSSRDRSRQIEGWHSGDDNSEKPTAQQTEVGKRNKVVSGLDRKGRNRFHTG